MENYLFRGFNVNDKGSTTIYLDHQKFTGNWITGYIVANNLQLDEAYMISTLDCIHPLDTDKFVPVVSNTISMYTGWNDGRNTKLFSNDIIRAMNTNGKPHPYYESFLIEWIDSIAGFRCKSLFNQNEVCSLSDLTHIQKMSNKFEQRGI